MSVEVAEVEKTSAEGRDEFERQKDEGQGEVVEGLEPQRRTIDRLSDVLE